MIDGDDLRTTAEEPSAEDFQAAEEELPPRGVRSALVRILTSVGIVFVVVALLVYIVVPFYITLRGAAYDSPRPRSGIRQIPVAPEPTSAPVRRA
jgi:hypothetical protein